jgi:hypothetical protein
MFITPWFGSDRDGEKLMAAMAAPNVPMADRRLNIPVTSERFMMVSIGSCSASQCDLIPMVQRFQFDSDRTVDVVNGHGMRASGARRRWISRRPQGRSVEITGDGIAALRELFGVRV